MFSIFDCETHTRVSDVAYATAEEANHDYHMNEGHTHIGDIAYERTRAIAAAGRRAAEIVAIGDTDCCEICGCIRSTKVIDGVRTCFMHVTEAQWGESVDICSRCGAHKFAHGMISSTCVDGNGLFEIQA